MVVVVPGQYRDNRFMNLLEDLPDSPTKKMLQNKNDFAHTYASDIAELRSFRLPVYRNTKDCDFVEYYAFNPAIGKLGRKRIKLNQIKGTRARKEYARGLIERLTDKLTHGWNPFIEEYSSSEMMLVGTALDEFAAYNERMKSEGTFRKQTYDGYNSFVNCVREFTVRPGNVITYLYQFDTKYCNKLLDDVFLVRKLSATTRNNYLGFLQVFFNYHKEKGHITVNPCENIKKIPRRMLKKQREIIPSDVISRMANYLKENDPLFLLACYLLYYCFIRPQELCRLTVGNIQIENHTIFIRGDQAKNRKDEYLTIPKKLEEYILSLDLLSVPKDWHIFSTGMKPGVNEILPMRFREHWATMRTALGFSSSYKLYSLKDTGITELADKKIPNITIRDQARHSSLAITDIYTRHAGSHAVHELLDYEGSL